MAKVRVVITTSVDGYITGPSDGPGRGLGEGGERLHAWVVGAMGRRLAGGRPGVDAAWFEEATHRPEEEPASGDFTFASGGGKHLFDGFTKALELEHLGVRQSPFATFIDYRLKP